MERVEVLTPGGLPEVRDALRRATPDSRILAGGTDLVIAIHENRCKPDLLIDLSGVRELSFVRYEGGCLRIGAGTTFTRISEDPLVRKYACCLAQAAAQVGSVQIRNRATLGGNIGTASPAGDAMPVLLAMGAVLHVMDAAGRITAKTAGEIVLGRGKTAPAPGEVITEAVFPVPGETYRSTFVKIGSRTAVTVAKLNMAVVVRYDSPTLFDAHVALGAIGPAAFRDARVEQVLNGRAADENLALAFGEALSAAVARAIPGRLSLPYKREAVKGLARDAWTNLFGCSEKCSSGGSGHPWFSGLI